MLLSTLSFSFTAVPVPSACASLGPAAHGRSRFSTLLALAALSVSLAAPLARAHPIHASYAEADYRPASGKLEIALRLFADDAETALTQRAGKKISLEKTPAGEIDALLFLLVRGAFVVKTRDGTAARLTWVGRELTDGGQHLWVYLSCPLPGGVGGARFASRVLRDVFADQLNSIRVRDHTATPPLATTLLFADTAEQALPAR
ncbi:MAG: hypothetical protein RLZZ15_2572 [Verrucomicrobiota bacterium]|jgi:hypothetical protein